MNVMHWIKSALLVAALISVAACSSHKKQDSSAINDANAAYGADASGMNGDERFGDEAGGGRLGSKKTYYFDFDSNIVHEEDRPAIEANADYLVSHPRVRIILEGHTDPRGSREYNIGLGERRAKAVAEILTAKGVRSSQIRIVSYGAEKLASPGRTESDYQLDRRVVLAHLQ
jgi:peptidoglycan-associated lipoprotein